MDDQHSTLHFEKDNILLAKLLKAIQTAVINYFFYYVT